MLTTREVEQHFNHLPLELLDIVLELRNIVGKVAPDATERIHRQGLTYYHGNIGGPVSAGICQILTCGDHIELAFIHGAYLPDPQRLLSGDRKVKRFVSVTSYKLAPWDDLEALILAHSRFDPYSQTFRE
jgi:hypothetical protein